MASSSARVYNDPYKNRKIREAGLGTGYANAVRPRASATPSMRLSYQDGIQTPPRIGKHPAQNLTRASDMRAQTTNAPLTHSYGRSVRGDDYHTVAIPDYKEPRTRRTNYNTVAAPDYEEEFYADNDEEEVPYRLRRNEFIAEDGTYYRVRGSVYRFFRALMWLTIGFVMGMITLFILLPVK
mgnify:CR=1 FL=1